MTRAGEPTAIEPRPPAAAAIFGDGTALADRFVGHLASSGVEWGLLGPRELPRLWSRHVLNCAVVSELLPPGASVVDVGSGAGLPGLALALARPDLTVSLLEPLERRVSWLRMVVDDLGVPVRVHRARAEEIRGRVSASVVTARAVAPLARLAGWALPLLEPDGRLLAIKGRSAADELEEARTALSRLGAVDWDIVRCGAGVLDSPTTVVRVRVGASRPAGANRRRRGR